MNKIKLLSLPIGNKDDLSFRVRYCLENGHLFLAEDTRAFVNFLSLLGITTSSKKILSFHDQTNIKKIDEYLEILKTEDLYVVSEAGSPIISDPGYPLVKRALEKGVDIETFPGVSSVIAALEVSGLAPIPFEFLGFAPRKESERKEVLESLKVGTHIFFESPQRVLSLLSDIALALPNADLAVVRELTKKFETVYRFKAEDFYKIKESILEKGEFVVLIYLSKEEKNNFSELKSLAQNCLEKRANTKSVSKLLSKILGLSSQNIYKELLKEDNLRRKS